MAAAVGGHVWPAAPVLHCRAPSIIKVLAAAISQTVGGHLHGLGHQRHDGGGNGDLPVFARCRFDAAYDALTLEVDVGKIQPAPCGAVMAALVLAERLPLFCLLQGCPAVDQAHGSGCHTGAGVGVQILLGGCPGGKAALFAGIDHRAGTHHAHLYCPRFPAPVDAALAVCALARLWRCRALLLFAAIRTV